MPIEAALLRDKPVKYTTCPKCGKPFEPFLRGCLQRFHWFGLRKKYCALICKACKKIVDYE